MAIFGILLGAAGMQLLHSRKPKLVQKAEDGIKRFVKSTGLSGSDNKKAKTK